MTDFDTNARDADAPAPRLEGAPDSSLPDRPERPVWRAVWHGLRRRCPRCGEGRMFDGYLKTRPSCDHCGQEFFHHRADDGPPYLTLLIVGHIVGPGMLWYYMAFRPEPVPFMLIFMAASLLMSLWCLPRLKGGLVGVQWATRMYGFDT